MKLHNPAREATRTVFERCRELIQDAPDSFALGEGETSVAQALWMCETALREMDSWPVNKASRWLGFIQAILCVHGITSVDVERDFSRPIFHAAYREKGQTLPASFERKDQ